MPYAKMERACNRCVKLKRQCSKTRPCQMCVHHGHAQTCKSDLDTFDAQRTDLMEAKNSLTERAPRACLRCARRKKRCDRGIPCVECMRVGVPHECRYTSSRASSTSSAAETASTAPDGMPSSEFVNEMCRAVQHGGTLWLFPCIDTSIVCATVQQVEAGQFSSNIQTAYMFAALAVSSALLPDAHPIRKRYAANTSADARAYYRTQAVSLLQNEDRYAMAIDASTPLLECWTYHLLWWYASVVADYQGSTYFCKQSFVSASMCNLFKEANDQVLDIIATQKSRSIDDSNTVLLHLGLDMLYVKSRVLLYGETSINDSKEDEFLLNAAKAVALCSTLLPKLKVFLFYRIELIVRVNKAKDTLTKITNSNVNEARIDLCLAYFEWLEGRERSLYQTSSKSWFGMDLSSCECLLPVLECKNDLTNFHTSTLVQLILCLHANRLAIECRILRHLCDQPGMVLQGHIRDVAFTKAVKILSTLKTWSDLVRSDWLYRPLCYVATPLQELGLQIFSFLISCRESEQKPQLTDASAAQKMVKSPGHDRCIAWLEQNFDEIYTLINLNHMHTPSLFTLAVAFKSIDVSGKVRLPATFGFFEANKARQLADEQQADDVSDKQVSRFSQ